MILERFKKVKGLEFNRDIRPTNEQLQFFQSQLKIVIVRVLTTYSPAFSSYVANPLLKHTLRRPMPRGYVTEQFPIRATTIEEATVRGNLLYHEDVFLNQLKKTPEQLCEYAIPTFNDQLTNLRIRSGQIMRARDLNPWTRRECLVLGFGLFHLCMNLIWALLHVHRGSLAATGSLSYFFTLMDKKWLNAEHPDYHTLLSALTQILDGILLNAWQHESGHQDLANYAATKPTAENLLEMASKILSTHGSPIIRPEFSEAERDDNSSEDEPSDESDAEHDQPTVPNVPPPTAGRPSEKTPDPTKDATHQNLRLLTCDLLYVAELIQAISDGDIGRIEAFLPQLAMIF